ncbi:hypothetical protein [Paucibacter sp. Y2R2-4]|uniref:hypothetical protein n=1 Tax=Paucibacter sp. Y2R2-4 TaxID=2893553 RepID=UPI0021E507B2|nr:hypothetical protein [Paucibacter sp. Y2R2-4]MCV2349422.1 hypothetical protein [Paucibacter sp. Y2R2-4]
MFMLHAPNLTRTLLLCASALVMASAAWAAPQPLADDEMRGVNGGQQQNLLSAGLPGLPLPLLQDLLSLDRLNAEKSKLSPAEFAAAVKAAGFSNALQLGYDGQGGTVVTLGASNLNAQLKLSDVISAGAGSFNSSASMGSIAIGNLDTAGTRLLMWHH